MKTNKKVDDGKSKKEEKVTNKPFYWACAIMVALLMIMFWEATEDVRILKAEKQEVEKFLNQKNLEEEFLSFRVKEALK